jgi:glycosyltransferase involved in cell wall biosynthesis
MKISGATFVRNALKFDYPVVQAITSVLPLCDQFVVNVGDSEDDTLDLVRSIRDRRLDIFTSRWDDTSRSGGLILSEQTNLALDRCDGDWIFYIQADEAMHERYLEPVQRRMEKHLADPGVEGLLFAFKHFYGSYFLVKDDRAWYRFEIRVIRNGIGVRSWKDAQGFRIDGRKLRVVPADAEIYHYGWARHPRLMTDKQMNLDRYWHDDAWIEEKYREGLILDRRHLVPFAGDHPAVMADRLAAADWDVFRDPDRRAPFKRSPWRRLGSLVDGIGEYRNYRLIRSGRKTGGE